MGGHVVKGGKGKFVPYHGLCQTCGQTVRIHAGRHAMAVTVLGRLTAMHHEISPTCPSGSLVLPMLSKLKPKARRAA
jgi:hypothetical protein